MEAPQRTTARPPAPTTSEFNRARISRYLFHHGVTTRAELARELGLTPAAITKIVNTLIESGLVHEIGHVDGLQNRRAIGIELNREAFHVVGVKFARSLVEIGTFDLQGHPIDPLTRLEGISNPTVAQTIAEVHRIVDEKIRNDKSIVAVGMAVPGPYDISQGKIAVVTSMNAWSSINFIDEFAEAFDVPVYVIQDARAGVIAQCLFDSDNRESAAYYLIGEGVGLGVIEKGEAIDGWLGFATEVGHISIDVNGLQCECGNRGCLEKYCSTVAIHNRLSQDYPSLIKGVRTLTHEEACHQLFTLADSGNKLAQSLVTEIAHYVAYGCIIIINGYNPRSIVLGDIVASGGKYLLNEVVKVVKQRAIPTLLQSTTIHFSNLTTDPILCGAAAIAVEQFLARPLTLLKSLKANR